MASAILLGASRVLAVVFALVATRSLQPPTFARYSVVVAAATLLGVFADLGTSTAITRVLSRAPQRTADLLGDTLILSVALGLCGFGLGFAYFWISDVGTLYDWVLGGPYVIGTSTLSSLTGALAGRGALVQRAGVQFASHVVSLGGGALVLALGGSLTMAFVALVAGPPVACVAAAILLYRVGAWPPRLHVDLLQCRALLAHALPFAALAAMAVIVAKADVLILAVVSTARETARYDLAVRVIEGTAFLTLAISAPMVFLLTRRLSVDDIDGAQRAFDLLCRWVVVAGAGIAAVLAPLAEATAVAAFGTNYRSVGSPLTVMAAFTWLNFLLAAQGGLLTSSSNPRKVVPLGATMVLVNLMMIALLLPGFGAMGAAWATVSTQLIAVFLYERTARRLTGVQTATPSIRVLIAGVLAALVTGVARNLPLAPAAVIGTVSYAIALAVARAVPASDIAKLRQLLLRRD